MQKKNLGDFAKRSLYYTSKAYVSQLDKGYKYDKLKKVYFIGILDFKMFSNKDSVNFAKLKIPLQSQHKPAFA
jgi:predicted transposase/invertase (TIGR01784 family)